MEPVNLFDLATQQSRWLAVRQSAVAGNVANVNTPGYGAMDVEPFEKVLDKSGVTIAATQVGHSTGRSTEAGFAIREEQRDVSLLPSENSVVLENELLKAGEIRRQFELNTAIVKAFHRMLMLTSKS
jgi:flagellar basal-body rod protein FlgB